jgi:dimethylaniline monooxygenase (N-oxide forming)
MDDVAVIGAGSSGLPVLKALRDHGVPVEGFERGSTVGGLWRYGNDNGMSSAYASLRTNVSRPRMQFPSYPMPPSYGDFPGHSDMAAYLRSYAETFGLLELIKFGTTVDRLRPDPDGAWRVLLDDGSTRRFRHVVVATGVFWCPRLVEYPGRFEGEISHSHDYRTPEPFTARRVLVVGSGQSAAEIATEVAQVAARCLMSVRTGAHVIPRWIAGAPYDASDVEPLNRMPWRLLNLVYGRRVAAELGPLPAEWPSADSRLLEGVPIVSSDLVPAVRRGEVTIKPAVDRLHDQRVVFVDGSTERIDAIICATGYRISVPFLPSGQLAPRGRDVALYRRIVPPALTGMFLAGFVDAPGGLLPVVETQADWIAAAVTGRLPLPPPPEQMWAAIERGERRSRQRFPADGAYSIRCDPHAYRRLLRSDLLFVRRATTRVPYSPPPTVTSPTARRSPPR